MNLTPIVGFNSKTIKITNNHKQFFNYIISKRQTSVTSFNTTHFKLSNHIFTKTPFLLKLQFLQTIRSTIPSVKYKYILPSERFTKTNLYAFNLNKRTSKHNMQKLTLNTLYSKLLKV